MADFNRRGIFAATALAIVAPGLLLRSTPAQAAPPAIPPSAPFVPNNKFIAKNYGVTADGKTAIDVGCTNGSAVISSASFTAADKTTPAKVINVYAGTSVTTNGATTNGSRVITTIVSTTGIAPLQSVSGTNIPAGAYVVAVDIANSRVFLNRSVAATGTGTVALTFINPISTTIIDAGAGTATLAVAASSTISATRAYFGTDDTLALQAVVDAANTNGSGLIELASGTSMITATINAATTNSGNWPSNVSMKGQSRGNSILRWASSQSMADTPGNRAVIYSVHGAYFASMANCVFSDFEINMDAATDTPYNYNGTAMRLVINRNITIQNMRFSGSPATCLGVDNPQNLLVTGCIFENCARLGVGGGGSFAVLMNQSIRNPENFTFTDNQIFNTGVFGVMWENFFASSTVTISDDTAIVANNYIYYDAYQPNATFCWGIQDAGGWGSVISGNIIKGPTINTTQFVGIGLGTGDKTTFQGGGGQTTHIIGNTIIGMGTPIYILADSSNDIVIENNIVTQGGRSTTGGIAINNNADGTSRAMSGMAIKNNKIFGNAGGGIVATTNTVANKSWLIQGNTIYNNGTVGAIRAGISIGTPQTGITIQGNVCYDDGTGAQQYGLQIITGTAVTGAFVEGNNFSGNSVAGVSAIGTITGVFRNNKGMPAPTVSGGATVATGDGDVGTYTSTVTGTCTAVIVPFGTANIIADNGYIGNAFDKTTTIDIQTQTAYTTTSATFSGTTVSGDVIAFNLRMF